MTNTTFATTNRDLENFLFNHGFTVSHTTKTYDYLTSWHFDLTDPINEGFEECLHEYQRVLERRHARHGKTGV